MSSNPAAEPQPARVSPSLATRLTLLHCACAPCILAARAALLYLVLLNEIDREYQHLVDTFLSVLTKDAEEPDTHFLVPGMRSAEHPYQMRVFDRDMKVI